MEQHHLAYWRHNRAGHRRIPEPLGLFGAGLLRGLLGRRAQQHPSARIHVDLDVRGLAVDFGQCLGREVGIEGRDVTGRARRRDGDRHGIDVHGVRVGGRVGDGVGHRTGTEVRAGDGAACSIARP
jgi:hypothetical protein